MTAHRKDDHIEAEKKVKAIMKWRETTINTLYHKIQKELNLINPSIPETKHAINKHEASVKLPHEEIQQSLETLYQEVSAKLTYSLVKLNQSLQKLKTLASSKHSRTSSETSIFIQLANQCSISLHSNVIIIVD